VPSICGCHLTRKSCRLHRHDLADSGFWRPSRLAFYSDLSVQTDSPIRFFQQRKLTSHVPNGVSSWPTTSSNNSDPAFTLSSGHSALLTWPRDILAVSDAEATSRTVEEQLSCSLRLLVFLPMHSDSQGFVCAAVWNSLTPAITLGRYILVPPGNGGSSL
jgi:hypothetical protein